MIEINVITGSEQHSSFGAYGKVLIDDGEGNFIHHWQTNKSEADWDEVIEVGYGGKHGKWIPSCLRLNEGDLLYVEGASTWRRKLKEKGRGWFRVKAGSPKIEVSTPGYGSNSLVVYGNLEQLKYKEMMALNLKPAIRSSKYLYIS